jgi:hypothetical protein
MTAIGKCLWCKSAMLPYSVNASEHYLRCSNAFKCDAQGPTRPTPEAAIVAWNRLATPDPERHLTGQEQRVMDAALRRSVAILPDDPTLIRCEDCQRPYGKPGFPDLVIPDADWKRISTTQDEGGLLCPSCICARLECAGIETTGRFRSGPLAEIEDPERVTGISDAPFPQPRRKDGGEPCGECHIQPGEKCDICGAGRSREGGDRG